MTRRSDVHVKLCSKLVNLLNTSSRVRTDRAFKELPDGEYSSLQQSASQMADRVDHIIRITGCAGVAPSPITKSVDIGSVGEEPAEAEH